MTIRNKLILLIFLFSIIPMVIVAFVSINIGQKAMYKVIGESSLAFSKAVVLDIQEEFYHAYENTISWADNAELKRELSVKRIDYEKITFIINDILESFHDYNYIEILDKNGIVVASTMKNGIRESYYEYDYFKRAINGEPVIGDVIFDKIINGYGIVFYVPIKDTSNGKILGVLSTSLKWEHLNEKLSRIKMLGKVQDMANHVMLARNDGLVIYCYDPSEVFVDNLISIGMESAKKAQNGEEGYLTEISEHHLKSFSTYVPIQDIYGVKIPKWFIVVLQDEDLIFQYIDKIKIFLMVISLFVLFSILITYFFITKRIINPITTLVQFTNKIDMETLDKSIEVISKDEIGTLAEAFNLMLHNLRDSRTKIFKAANVIKESEEKFKGIFDYSNDGIIIVDVQAWVITLGNNKFNEMLCLTNDDVMDLTFEQIFPPENKTIVIEKFLEAVSKTSMVLNDIPIQGRNGIFYTEISAASLSIAEKKYLICHIRDITERRNALDKINSSLRVKELLLKEIHHRVKNNLQIISSLLKSQSRLITDEFVLNLFQDSQNRIRSMALIHEKLYSSDDLSKVDFSDYVKDIGTHLVKSYKNQTSIIIKRNVEKIFLSIDNAIPCGLIITELISNSIKYAFQNMERGVITVDVFRIDGKIQLIVSDNGRGLPADFEIKRTGSLGLHLVEMLATKQLNGTFEIDGTEGTSFIIVFKESGALVNI